MTEGSMTITIWEVTDNLLPHEAQQIGHFRDRRIAVNVGMGALQAVFTANPGSYWRIESWTADGNARSTVRVGPGANSTILADVSLIERTLTGENP
jgi:hypothetical protein